MKLCSDCRKKPWPYAIAVFLAGFVGFITWLTLSTTNITPNTIHWLSFGAFVVAAGVLLTYMISCMRRHCRGDGHSH